MDFTRAFGLKVCKLRRRIHSSAIGESYWLSVWDIPEWIKGRHEEARGPSARHRGSLSHRFRVRTYWSLCAVQTSSLQTHCLLVFILTSKLVKTFRSFRKNKQLSEINLYLVLKVLQSFVSHATNWASM